MSKRRLFVTIVVFVLTLALVVGSSYLLSRLLKNPDQKSLDAIYGSINMNKSVLTDTLLF